MDNIVFSVISFCYLALFGEYFMLFYEAEYYPISCKNLAYFTLESTVVHSQVHADTIINSTVFGVGQALHKVTNTSEDNLQSSPTFHKDHVETTTMTTNTHKLNDAQLMTELTGEVPPVTHIPEVTFFTI
jgi:hypothetical protein